MEIFTSTETIVFNKRSLEIATIVSLMSRMLPKDNTNSLVLSVLSMLLQLKSNILSAYKVTRWVMTG